MGNDLYIETKEGDLIAWLGRKYHYTDRLNDAEINMLFADLSEVMMKIACFDTGFEDFKKYKIEKERLIVELIEELEKRGARKVLDAVMEEGYARLMSDYEKEGVKLDDNY